MDTLKIKMHHIKSINDAQFELPFENGIYTLVGVNGSGKSTVMLCLAQLMSDQLIHLTQNDIKRDSFVQYEIAGQGNLWKINHENKWYRAHEALEKYNGLYEGSLFYGTRFEDSSKIENMITQGRITNNMLADADDYVKQQMSYILHGDTAHYKTLKRLKNKYVAQKLSIKNRPYFISIEEHFISQYRMSSGECLLVSLLHFVYNAIIRRSLPSDKKVLVLIDELELALHPIAVLRLMELLKELVNKHSNLIVYLSTHSPEIIRTMPPSQLFKVNNNNGDLTLESNCYPSYLIRDLYSNVSPDFLLLVEDELSQLVVNKILSNYALRNSKLIHCIPVGGWQNVLELHKELYTKKVLGSNTVIISILDGDIADELNKEQKNYHIYFCLFQALKNFYIVLLKKITIQYYEKLLTTSILL